MSRLQQARTGYRESNYHLSRKAHTKEQIRKAKEEHKSSGEYLGDFVFGAIDGSVTTFAVVSGVAGASLSTSVLLILGFANLFADGLAMAIGNFMSTKSDIEFARRERERETWEIQHFPDGEREEIREIYRRKGLEGQQLDNVVEALTSNESIWIDTMMTEELGLIPEPKSPLKTGWVTFLAFVVAGFIPLISYVLSYFVDGIRSMAYPISILLTGIAFFSIGLMKVYITDRKWWLSGFETLLMGSLAAGVAYLVGYILKGIV